MKKTLLLTTALASGLFVTAQTRSIKHFSIKNQDSRHISLINNLLQGGSTVVQKPTGTAQRVLAQVYNEANASDSTHFKYTGTRGSNYEHNTMDFGYNLDFGSSYVPMINILARDPLNMLADSITAFEDNVVYRATKAFYRAGNKLDSFYSDNYSGSNPPDRNRTIHSYYPGGYLKEAISLYTEGSSTDTVQVRKLTYNAAYDKVVTDSLFVNLGGPGIEPYMAQTYHYNTQGNADTINIFQYTGSALILNQKIAIVYTADEKPQNLYSYFIAPNSSQSMLYQTDTLAYANNSAYFTFWESRQLDEDGLIQDGSRMIKNPGSNGFPDSVVMYSYGANWQEDLTLHYTYNSSKNPVTLTASVEGIPEDGAITFYYEVYDDGQGTSIKPVAENKDFTVYPNPFSSNINIDWKGKAQSNVTVKLTNIVGQEVFKTAMKMNAGQNTISLPALTSGNYILLLQDANGKSWSNKMVKK